MNKIFRATCEANTVKFGDVVVDDAVVLSQGTKASEGVGLLDEDEFTYLTSNAEDIAALIQTLGDMVQKIIQITTTLDAATLSPGGAAANIALLTTMNTQLGLMKDNLK